MAEADRRLGVPPEAFVAALVLAAAFPLGRLFEPGRLWSVVVMSMLVCLGVSWCARRFRAPALVAWLASTAMLFWWLSVLFFGETLWGPFASADSIRAIGAAARLGSRIVVQEVAPVEPTPPVLMFVAAGVWVTTWLAEAAMMWIRNGLLAVATTVPLFVVPGAVRAGSRRVLETAIFLTAVGAVLFIDQRARMARHAPRRTEQVRTAWGASAAVRMLGIAIAVVVAVSPLMPGFADPPGFDVSGSGARGDSIRLDPLVAINPTLRTPERRTLFTVRTQRPTYYRLTSVEIFDGRAWRPGRRTSAPVLDGRVPEFTPSGESDAVLQEISMIALAGEWLPAASEPSRIDVNEPVSVERPTRALLVNGGLRTGATYRVISRVPTPDAETLDRPITYDAATIAPYVALPDSLPNRILEIAREWTRGQATPYRKAVAIQDRLRTFTYDENVADGHDFDTLEEFLTRTRRGYCEQFAGSMAVLTRALGIPSRVAIGFGRGERLPDGSYEVTTRHAHAWVELFFPGHGWLPFEPTPRAGVAQPPQYTRPAEEGTEAEARDQQAQEEEDERDAAQGRAPEDDAGVDGAAGDTQRANPLVVLAVVLLVAATTLLAWPHVRRLLRARRAMQPAEQVVLRYADLLAWTAAAGIPRAAAETPAEHAARLGAAAEAAADPARQVARLAEEALWGPPNGLDPASFDRAAAGVKAAVRDALPTGRRLLASVGWGRWRSAT